LSRHARQTSVATGHAQDDGYLAVSSRHGDRSVVVAVVFVGPVQPPPDQVVDVIAVRYRLVPAIGAMGVPGVTADRVGVVAWVRLIDLDHVLVNVLIVRVVQMAVMKVVDVIAVADRRVTTARPVLV
jgi:hypothetical protein